MNRDKASDFIWKIIRICFLEDSLDKTFLYVQNNLIDHQDLQANVETFLNKYLINKKRKNLLNLALWCARNFYFDIERHVILVAILLNEDSLTQEESLKILRLNYDQSGRFSSDVEKVVDVVWLLNEDAKDGVMGPSQDDILKLTLLNLLEKTKINSDKY